MRALCRQSALTSPIALRLGPLLSRFAGEDKGRDVQFQNLTGQQCTRGRRGRKICAYDSGESRDPDLKPMHVRKVWDPTFVGVTENILDLRCVLA